MADVGILCCGVNIFKGGRLMKYLLISLIILLGGFISAQTPLPKTLKSGNVEVRQQELMQELKKYNDAWNEFKDWTYDYNEYSESLILDSVSFNTLRGWLVDFLDSRNKMVTTDYRLEGDYPDRKWCFNVTARKFGDRPFVLRYTGSNIYKYNSRISAEMAGLLKGIIVHDNDIKHGQTGGVYKRKKPNK